jgi:hypothetical protein
VPDSTCSEVETATGKLKKYKSPGSDQILTELTQAGGKTLHEIHKIIHSIWNKQEQPDHWMESIIVPVSKLVYKLIAIIIMGYHCYQLHTKIISNIQGDYKRND